MVKMRREAFYNSRYCYLLPGGYVSELYRTKLPGLYWTPGYYYSRLGFDQILVTVGDFGDLVPTRIKDYTHPTYRN